MGTPLLAVPEIAAEVEVDSQFAPLVGAAMEMDGPVPLRVAAKVVVAVYPTVVFAVTVMVVSPALRWGVKDHVVVPVAVPLPMVAPLRE